MRVIERYFSDREEYSSVPIANLHVTAEMETNLARMEEIVQLAHERGADIGVFPELLRTSPSIAQSTTRGRSTSTTRRILPPLEQRYCREGTSERLPIQRRRGRFGFLICYDLCFDDPPKNYAFRDHAGAIVTRAHRRSEAVREHAHLNVMSGYYWGFFWNLMNCLKAASNQLWSPGGERGRATRCNRELPLGREHYLGALRDANGRKSHLAQQRKAA